MKVLIYSRGYPNPIEPGRSAFVREIIRFLPSEINIAVVAPVPFFLSQRMKNSAQKIPLMRIDRIGEREVEVWHPRFPLLPKNLLRPAVARLQARFTYSCVKGIRDQSGIDLIHANWGFPDGCAVFWLSRKLGIPYVLTEHQGAIGDLLKIKYYNHLLGRSYRGSLKFILVSESLNEPLSQVEGGIPEPEIIPTGIDTQRFTTTTKRPRPEKLVYIGNLIPEKGVQYLLRALKLLLDKSKDYSLHIIGAGKYRPELEKEVTALSLGQKVVFKGAVAAEAIPSLLYDYDVLVLPTMVESFGLVLIEAMAAGLPVISTCSGGPEKIVTPETGILVQPGSEVALADAILALEDRWDEFDPLKIRAICQQRFDLGKLVPRLAQLYREALASPELEK